MARITYNERSWAIDVISEINLYLTNKSWYFKGAGGENTITKNKKSLFPDILLFKDSTKNTIVQGWELKMPDTKITDQELIDNAVKKANILKRNSFILWNVKRAVLYVREEDIFRLHKSWTGIDINTRIEVKSNESLWKELLYKILKDINTYFELGEITPVTSNEILSIDHVVDLVLENKSETANQIKTRARANPKLDAEISFWWNAAYVEYGISKLDEVRKLKYTTLSKVVLTDWVFKIVFANILKVHFNEARRIEEIQPTTLIEEAIEIIESISENCNFWNILSINLGQEYISEIAWENLIELNIFLSTINVKAIDIEILHQLLQSSVASARRKVAGQYSTPPKLANLLSRLTIDDKTKIVLDPCCGTGTIVHQAYQLKEEYELDQEAILKSVWASDKHSFPVQLSTLSMARPSNIGKIIHIFNSDVVELEKNKRIPFRNPNNGELVEFEFPQIDYVVSNLPFIKNKDMKVLNQDIIDINDWIQAQTEDTEVLSGKSDIFAYIPFYLHQILAEDGKIGLILSNAWLGTDYGETFLNIFQKFYNVQYVVISGNGKWFDNAKVVTTILVASKKNPKVKTKPTTKISFCVLQQNLNDVTEIKNISDAIILGQTTKEVVINLYSIKQVNRFINIGLPWTGYFTNLAWLTSIEPKIVKLKRYFNLSRGERRGWNAMFYPEKNNIEENYLKPILKNLKSTKGLVATTNKMAFCCSRSLSELEELNHTGALEWIKSFQHQTNNNGKLLTESLKRANHFWYEMKTENMADFVANVNYDKSLFIAKFDQPTFIDQRMIGLKLKSKYHEEKDLLFALLNCTLSMFFIESYGFGRGQGALDLRSEKIARDFNVLNPKLLDKRQKAKILKAFQPILSRNRLPLKEELESTDRVKFEKILMESYGIWEYYNLIKKSLIELYDIRFAVKN